MSFNYIQFSVGWSLIVVHVTTRFPAGGNFVRPQRFKLRFWNKGENVTFSIYKTGSTSFLYIYKHILNCGHTFIKYSNSISGGDQIKKLQWLNTLITVFPAKISCVECDKRFLGLYIVLDIEVILTQQNIKKM